MDTTFSNCSDNIFVGSGVSLHAQKCYSTLMKCPTGRQDCLLGHYDNLAFLVPTSRIECWSRALACWQCKRNRFVRMQRANSYYKLLLALKANYLDIVFLLALTGFGRCVTCKGILLDLLVQVFFFLGHGSKRIVHRDSVHCLINIEEHVFPSLDLA